MYVCMYADFCIMMNLNTFCDLVCVHWVHDVRSISTWYGVVLTWRVTLYECVLSVSQATGQRTSNRVGVEWC